MKKNKIVAVMSATAIVSLFMSSVVMAADGDVYDSKTHELKHSFSQYSKNSKKFGEFARDMILRTSKFSYEYNGKIYSAKDILKLDTEDENNFKAGLEKLQNDKNVKKIDVDDFKHNEKNVLKVESVSAINATQMNVVFSGKVDKASAESLDNYTADKGLTITAAKLQEDGVTVKLTTSAQSAVVTYKVSVANVKNADKTSTIEAKDFMVKGSESPVVVSAYSQADAANKKDITENGYVSLVNARHATGLNLVFNSAIDASSVNSTTAKLHDDTTGDYIPVTLLVAGSEIKVNATTQTLMVAGHKYSIEVASTVKSVGGFELGEAKKVSFIIGDAIASADVTITTTTEVTTNVEVTFPATMDQTTVLASGAIKVEKLDSLGNVAGEVEGTVTYDAQMRKATFKPAKALDGETTYKVTVAKTVKKTTGIAMDDNATHQFTTATLKKAVVDTAKIATKDDGTVVDLVNGMTGVSLNGDATNVADWDAEDGTNADVKIAFKTPTGIALDPTTIKANQTVFLLNETTGEYLPIVVKSIAGNKTVAVYFDKTNNKAKLSAGNKYKLTLTGIKDNSANKNVIDDVNYSFTAETAAPVVKGFYLGTDDANMSNNKAVKSGDANLTNTSNLYVEFDKNLKGATVANAVLYDLTANTQNTLTVIGDDTTKIVKIQGLALATDFVNDHKYKLVLPTTITDADGHALDVKQEIVFTVGDAPSIVEATGNANITYVKADGTTPKIAVAGTTADVTKDSALKIEFSEKVDKASLTSANIVLKETVSGTAVATSFALAADGKTVVVTPNEALKNATSYTISVSGVTDLVGNKFDKSKSYVFKTEDTAKTAVTSSVADKAVIAKDSKVVLTFTKDVKAAAVNANITLKKVNADGTLDATDLVDADNSGLTYNSATRQLTIDLTSIHGAATMAYGTNYKLILDGAAGKFDLENGKNYELNFSTAKDEVKPTVAKMTVNSVDVKNGDTNVAADKDLVITFADKDLVAVAEEVNSTKNYVKLYNLDSQSYVDVGAWKITIADANPDTLTISESTVDKIKDGGHYRLTITGAKDAEGNEMVPYSIDFTAGAGVAMTANKAAGYVSKTPGTTDKNVAIDTAKVGVNFDKEIDTRTVTADTAYLLNTKTGAKVDVDVAFSGANHDITLTAKADLDYATSYKAVFTDGIKDVAGNKATAKTEISFATIADTTSYTYVDTFKSGDTGLTDGGTAAVAKTDFFEIAFTDAITKEGVKVTLEDVTPGATAQPMLLDGGITVTSKTLKIDPVGTTLVSGHVYKLTVSGVKSADGKKTIQAPVVYTFGVN